jgi:hypothetical protein
MGDAIETADEEISLFFIFNSLIHHELWNAIETRDGLLSVLY